MCDRNPKRLQCTRWLSLHTCCKVSHSDLYACGSTSFRLCMQRCMKQGSLASLPIAGFQGAAGQQQQPLFEMEPQSPQASTASVIQTDLEGGISNFSNDSPSSVPYNERQHGHIGMSELHAHLPAAVSMTHDSTQ